MNYDRISYTNLRKVYIIMNENNLLDTIFTLTSELYAQMSLPDTTTEKDHRKIFVLLTELARNLVNADRASFWKWDKREHTLWTTAAVGTDRITIPEDTGLVGKALKEKRTIVTNDPYNCPDFNSDVDKSTGYVTRSILVMPVCDCKGEFIGAYQAINKLDGDGFNTEEDAKRLSLAAFICGITLESEIFLDDSRHDKLTCLKNRMGFHADYDSDYLTAAKNGRDVSMFICDIDFFKKFNDTYGHNAGDAVLRHVADTFRECAGRKYGVYRWGG